MVVDCHALRARNDEWIATPFGLAMTAFRHREGPTGPWRSTALPIKLSP